MKKLTTLYTLVLSLAASCLVGCDDWTENEAEVFPEVPTSDEYYEALRAYKQTDHQVSFGWYGGWTGTGAYMKNSLAGLPDSLDIVSIWNNGLQLTDAQIKDMRFVQQTKGTKVVLCQILKNVGDGVTPAHVTEGLEADTPEFIAAQAAFWGFPEDESNQEAIDNAIRKYAKAVVDSLEYYGYDGFDIDYEPVAGPYHGNLVQQGSNDRLAVFIDEMGKYFGPKSNTGKLLMVDGEPQRMTDCPEIGTYLDYFVIQAYNPRGDSNLDGRLIDGDVWGPALVATFEGVMSEEEITKKTIMTENFEAVDAAMNGGYNYTDRWGNSMMSLEGMARWQPRNGFAKGGAGVYHLEAEFTTTPECKNIRKAIQIMNPSSHSFTKK